jgi:hypothetical protein
VKKCRITADGRSGYCQTDKRAWEKKKVPVAEIGPGRIQHPHLPDFFLDIMRWTYRVVGRYIQPTLEQWELGFMRDRNVQTELQFWHRAAFGFITYHQRRGLALRSDPEEQQLVGALVELASEAPRDGKSDEKTFIRQCFAAPDGWQQEVDRVRALAGLPDARWSPPEHLKDWPGHGG